MIEENCHTIETQIHLRPVSKIAARSYLDINRRLSVCILIV